IASTTVLVEDAMEMEYVFFFQAEDGIRDFHVTGVQTCALPISGGGTGASGGRGEAAAGPFVKCGAVKVNKVAVDAVQPDDLAGWVQRGGASWPRRRHS